MESDIASMNESLPFCISLVIWAYMFCIQSWMFGMLQTYLMDYLPLAPKNVLVCFEILSYFPILLMLFGVWSDHVKFDVILDALILFSFHGIFWHMIHHVCLSAIP